ncbi:hypothetical protein DAEQUDRAFT_723346 [Daedalea quercina L-15889]|uniref:Uncharacterized protein n=1 Tax=Daedalea quercina L-15889 TaxID=1314783 RepID=A0A165SLC6_9APHY|nr:hypothetical protein DAEQUDRAFT_723346 [Daedalea quercina L-15889]
MSPDPLPSSSRRAAPLAGRPVGLQEANSNEKVSTWLASVDGIHLTLGGTCTVDGCGVGTHAPPVAIGGPETDATYTNVCLTTSRLPAGQTTSSELSSSSTSLGIQSNVPTTSRESRLVQPRSMSTAAVQRPSSLDIPVDPDSDSGCPADSVASGDRYSNEGSSTMTASSSASGLGHLDFNVTPLDLQLPPVTRSLSQAADGSLPGTAASVSDTLRSCARPASSSRQSLAPIIINRGRITYQRPTYPDAAPLNLRNGAPARTNDSIFDDIVTLLRPSTSFNAPALGYYNLPRATPRKSLILIGSDRPFGSPGDQDNVLTDMFRLTHRRC